VNSVHHNSYCAIHRLVHGNGILMGIPWETSHGMGWDGTGINYNPKLVHGNVIPMGIPLETTLRMGWDGTGINCYGMGMGQICMSHGQPWQYIMAKVLQKCRNFSFYNTVYSAHNENKIQYPDIDMCIVEPLV